MSETAKPPGHDIFCTPENSEFVSKVPYQSLSKTDHEIRLLKILPDSGSGFVECELLPPVSLANVQKQYLALSYCAGSAKNTKAIKVNGVNSNVFANLHHALMSVRHYWETHAELPEFLLWVDQICINQFDLAERSHQVGFMRDIYESAKRTLICLSTEGMDGEVMRWFADLKDMVAQEKIMRLENFIAQKSETEEFAQGLTSFADIVKCPWWGRAWVFQEFMVSTHATFLFGRYSMPHGDFGELAIKYYWTMGLILSNHYPKSRLRQQLEKHQDSSEPSLWHCISMIRNIFEAKRKAPTPNDLESLLLYTRDLQAFDQRDKIYSVLGLASSGYAIMPDYSPDNDIHKLLVKTSWRIISFEDSLSILSNLNCYDALNPSRRHLPSWVIDWSNAVLPSVIRLRGDQDRKPRMSYFTDHKITAGSIDARFAEVQHPDNPRRMTTTLQVWAILLDQCFEKVGNSGGSPLVLLYKGWYCIIESYLPIERGLEELWILCGACEPFLLVEYSYGYRILFPVKITNAVTEDGVTRLPQFMDDQGIYDTSKMNWRRITIF